MPDFHSELTLPPHRASPGIARAWIEHIAPVADLTPDHSDGLAAAVEAACQDIVQFASPDDDPRTFSLAATVTLRALSLTLREHGAPFDPTQPAADLAVGADTLPGPVRRPAWELLQHTADTAHWSSRGKAGMELHLSIQRPQPDLTAHLSAPALTPFQAEEPPAPEQTYTIRRLEPREALGVAQCVYRAYGYTYANPDLYYPDRIAHLNETGQLVSIVALDASSAVVGHLALERPDLGPTAEVGIAVVNPAHRGRHLLERMRAGLEDEGRKLRLEGLLCYPVTSHVYSQKMEEAVGGRVCGVMLGAEPRSTSFKHITTGPLSQRGSTMAYFRYLIPPPSARVYALPHHQPLLERIYMHLEAPVTFQQPVPAAGSGEAQVTLNRAWGYGEIRVQRIGADTGATIRQSLHDLCAVAKAQVVYLYLPLAQPGAAEACHAAEAAGFFFSSLAPRFLPDGDAVCLQYLAVPLDVAQVQVASPLGQDLLAYAAAERQRLAAGKAP